MNEFLEDLFNKRGPESQGYTALGFGVERHGGTLVPVLSEEPDPRTFRGDYYYNTADNVLYKRIVVRRKPEIGLLIAFWQPVSNPRIGEE